MSMSDRIAPIDVIKVFIKENRVKRIKRKRAKLAAERQEIYHQLQKNEELDQALSDREGDLTSQIEHSGVYD